MKHKILLLLGVAAMCSLPTACVHLGDLELEPVPDIAFSYEIDGLSYSFASTTPGTSNITWNVLGQGTGSGETFKFTFPKPGSYWVSMTGTYNGEEQTVSTKLLVAKASVVKLDDNSVADWEKVTYPDFYFPGQKGYSTKSMGVEWYYEGQGWNHDPWGNMWTPASLESGVDPGMTLPIKWGYIGVIDGNTVFEFGLDRNAYGANTSKIGLFTQFYTIDWSGAETFQNSEGATSIHLSLDKME